MVSFCGPYGLNFELFLTLSSKLKNKLTMDPLSMEKAMIKNMVDKTGRPIDDWLMIVSKQKFNKHNEIVHFLKKDYSMTHGYANLIARKSKKI